jgi:hypothetical protein
MRIETTEHGRHITIDVTEEGVRVRVLPPPPPTELVSRGVPMIVVASGGGAARSFCPSCGEHHDPTEHLYCPICTGRHDPGECAPTKSVTTDLRKEARS